MLVPIERFLDLPILSLQTGAELARTGTVVIDPRKLRIVAFRVFGNRLDHTDSVLHPEDIREISDVGFIVDSSDQLMSAEGLVRLKEIIDFKFELVGIKVEDEHSRKLGTVKDYSVDPETFAVQQLYVKPSGLRNLSMAILTIHRSQVISITNEKITVKSAAIKESEQSHAAPQPFINPFRSAVPTQPETKDL